MKHNLILASALLLYCALTVPLYCFFCVFLYLIPLFYLVIRAQGALSFRDGFLWGIIFYTLHWYDIAVLAHLHGHGIGRYAVMPFLVLCSATYAGIWFWSATQLAVRTQSWGIAWISTTWIYTIFMQRASFWMLGRVQGYPFSFPLIPLAEYPQTLYAVKVLHPHIVLLFLIIASWGIAWCLHEKGSRALRWGALACYAPFMIGFLSVGQKNDTYEKPPARYSTLGYVSPDGLAKSPVERVGGLARRCTELVNHNNNITHILTPESTLPFALNEHPDLIQTLGQNIADEALILVLGCQRNEENRYYNCCYFLRNRLIIQGYDKSLLMPFAEYIPNYWLNVGGINRIFLHNKRIMNWNSKKGAIFCDFCLLICSDYYLDWYDEPQKTAVPLLLMVNENWFIGRTFKHLMMLTARYGALARRQDIIYVGHTAGIYFSRDGQKWKLAQ